MVILNGTDGIDLKLEAELAELPEAEAAAFREGASPRSTRWCAVSSRRST